MKVNAGDKLTLSARSFYNSQASYTRDQLLPEMLLMLLDGLMNPTGLTGQTGTVAREVVSNQLFSLPSTYSNALNSIASDVYNNTEEKPKAFMVWMLFDNEFNLVKSSSGMLQVGEAGSPAKNMVRNDIIMDRGGYFFAYLVNESPVNVYFDDFKVTHITGKVLEENHYYPFGMLNAQLSVQPTDKPLNYYKDNGKELQKELNLEWLDYGARFYDAQVGRFHSIDPLAENYMYQSPFAYASNNPIRYIDWMGMGPKDPPKGTTQLYLKFNGSFGPQLGFNVGDIASGSVSRANIVGETKVGINISPEGKMRFLFEQTSKNVNYEIEGSIPIVGGVSKSSEYITTEHPSFAVEKNEKQKGFVKEVKTESDGSVNKVESTTYEVGFGVKAILLGFGVFFGFESTEVQQ